MSTDDVVEKPRSAAETRLKLIIIAGIVAASPIVVPLLDGTVSTKRQFNVIHSALDSGPRLGTYEDSSGAYRMRLSTSDHRILVDSPDFSCSWLLDADKMKDDMIRTTVTPHENCKEHGFSLRLDGDEILLRMDAINYGTVYIEFPET